MPRIVSGSTECVKLVVFDDGASFLNSKGSVPFSDASVKIDGNTGEVLSPNFFRKSNSQAIVTATGVSVSDNANHFNALEISAPSSPLISTSKGILPTA